jgi:hypothetical protein
MKILISGDSWAAGEWPVDSTIGTHQGLIHYFREDGHEVTSRAMPGADSLGTITGLIENMDNDDYIFWFQTDPLRNLRPYKELGTTIKTYTDLVQKNDEILDIAYRYLNSIGKKIHCLGGCGKLDLNLIKNYNNLIPLIPSVTELLLKDYEHPRLWFSDWYDKVDENFDMDSIDLFLIDKRKQDSLALDLDKKEFFWPDGGHPNRKGHKVLYEHICEKLDIYSKNLC